ncbi:Oxoglutarate and iron-dependent oxygenase degradation C-term-domain-containing protein [Lactarius pseudohatsudake]|nr:Oxoglutarate and iron-dependent oxygenase degradation C-term-domain-containing protein [Lactarius pseudohatsudake]
MVKTHPRSPSPEPEVKGMKRPKIAHESSKPHPAPPSPHDLTACFAPDLFDPAHVGGLAASYSTGEPFKHALVQKLFQDDLLQQVKDECLSELHFTEKETDIYKVNQTGDLASLSYLTEQQVAFLPNLIKLRDALYSQKFRDFLRKVTGCGPLSGVKQDMSVNTYRKGCHLLNHDDVIGTRRVSYILYMPLPHYQLWQKEWGGALELYPVREGADGTLEPEPVPAKSIPPSWNQFIFFEVQPGRSFHSVEEVVVGEGEDGWQRLSISGWFHAAQPGEDGYEGDGETVPSVASSREQLTSTSTTEFKSYSGSETPPLPDTPLAEGHLSFLSEFLNPAYLQPRTIKALASRFMGELSLELHDFLSGPIAERLDAGLREMDARDGLGKDRPAPIPPHTAGTAGWRIKGPPHKWRYNVLEPTTPGGRSTAVSPRAAQLPLALLRSLQDELFPSPAFRAWLAAVSKLLVLRYAVEARRFCPGLGYTLATSEEREARLDVVLSLTPQVNEVEETKGKGKAREEAREKQPVGWQTGEWGGWECYMAPHEEEDDPAVYRSGSHKKAEHNGDGHAVNGNGSAGSSNDNDEVEMEDSDDEDEDATLLTSQPGFNRLLLVLRDEGVMRFVKYVSAAAEGSRWDVCGEYEVGMIEADDSDD